MEIDGDTLRVQANSDARIREATTLVAELLPDATLVDDDVRDLDEMMRDTPLDPGGFDPDRLRELLDLE
jgi:hypothetical protein